MVVTYRVSVFLCLGSFVYSSKKKKKNATAHDLLVDNPLTLTLEEQSKLTM